MSKNCLPFIVILKKKKKKKGRRRRRRRKKQIVKLCVQLGVSLELQIIVPIALFVSIFFFFQI